MHLWNNAITDLHKKDGRCVFATETLRSLLQDKTHLVVLLHAEDISTRRAVAVCCAHSNVHVFGNADFNVFGHSSGKLPVSCNYCK